MCVYKVKGLTRVESNDNMSILSIFQSARGRTAADHFEGGSCGQTVFALLDLDLAVDHGHEQQDSKEGTHFD